MFQKSLIIILVCLMQLMLPACVSKKRKIERKDVENAYLVRYQNDSTWTIPNTDCYYVKDAAMNMDHGGWHWPTDLEGKNSDFFYWEAETHGMLKLEFDLPKNIKAINLDTISRLNYDLINYFTGDMRSDSTKDHLSGTLTFTQISDTSMSIDGIIAINTVKPTTRQEIVFNNHTLRIYTLPEIVNRFKEQQEEIRQILRKQME